MPHRVDETVITTSATVGSRGLNVLGELDMYRRSKGRSKPGRAELFDVIGIFPDSQKSTSSSVRSLSMTNATPEK